jgi:hypothetical protein
MITLPEWTRREDLREEWAQALATRSVSSALELAANLGAPKSVVVPEGFSGMEWNALQNARREGFFECLQLLRDLAERPADPVVATDDAPWTHYLKSLDVEGEHPPDDAQ